MTPAKTRARLVSQAAALVPMLRASAPAAESARRLPREIFDALAAADVFRMTAPQRFGGFEADFRTQCEVLAEVARGCPSASWVATILSAMSWLVSGFPDETQEEILGARDPRVSGVFSPTGKAVRKQGGYVVNGRWGYNTGGHGGDWTVVNAVLFEDGAAGMPHCCIVRSKELERLDDWRASGMAATGSSTVLAKDVFVPAHRVLPLPELVEGRYPARHNAANPYFNYPLAAVLTANAAGTPVGIARGALELFQERLPGRAITYTTYASKIEAPVTHLQVGDAALAIDSSYAHLRLACSLLDEAEGAPSKLDRVRIRAHVGATTRYAREAVDGLFYASGASVIQADVPMQSFQRDMQALANHAIMHPQTNVELYGRVLCGLEPNTFLY
ncbi:MAG TPA: acyl-CoA dehydrogenase family protein [Gammaproteobacteria bacterium]|nr:acyl-CoA dehydrogenase family protein [Gammaproteobacteria bacterium]